MMQIFSPEIFQLFYRNAPALTRPTYKKTVIFI